MLRPTFLLILVILLLPAACVNPVERVLPIPASVRGASMVSEVELVVRPTARDALAKLDARAAGRAGPQAGYAALPFEVMLANTVRDVTREWGLTSGRPLKLVIELDRIAVVDTGRAIVGGRDRLAGTVFLRDAATGEPLGQLYVDVGHSNAGLLAAALRGGGVRERLAREFALHIAREMR